MEKVDLIKIIGGINSDFPYDKLAFLAMTSKIEHQLRDAISHQIHLHHYTSSSTSFVCREWKKIDAAVVDKNNNPELLIEFKSHNSINFPGFLLERKNNPKDSYPIVKDINKLLDKAKPGSPKLYFIFFNNIVKSPTTTIFPKNCKGESNNPIAYHTLVNNQINLSYINKVKRVLKNWAYMLEQLKLPLNLTSVVEFNVGKYRNIEVSILAFIYGPIENDKIAKSLVLNLPGTNEKIFDNPGFDQTNFENIDLNGIDFYYEDIELENIGNGINCFQINNYTN